MKSPDVNGRDAFASLQTVARYRNGGTNSRVCVPKHGKKCRRMPGSNSRFMAYRHGLLLNSWMLEGSKWVEIVRDLTFIGRRPPNNWRSTYILELSGAR